MPLLRPRLDDLQAIPAERSFQIPFGIVISKAMKKGPT